MKDEALRGPAFAKSTPDSAGAVNEMKIQDFEVAVSRVRPILDGKLAEYVDIDPASYRIVFHKSE